MQSRGLLLITGVVVATGLTCSCGDSTIGGPPGRADAQTSLDSGVDGGPLPDSGLTDGGLVDTGLIDSGPSDGGLDGGGPADTGLADAAAPDLGMGACNECHGDETGIAPPFDTLGNTATTMIGVGAHRSHLRIDTGWHRDVQCDDCHTVPTQVGDPGHNDTMLPAELTWGAIPLLDGASPSFDRGTTTCSGVYCHGETLSGGTNTTVNWTNVSAGEAACGTCHGIPPAEPHPVNLACSTCHPTMGVSLNIILPQRHIDGILDLTPGALDCSTCHGASDSAAPPRDTLGNVNTTDRGVGAHRSHLGTSVWHREILCDDCHVVPADISDTGHMDSALPAELTWGSVPLSDGATPSFDGTSTSCSGVYCHGATLLPGGTNTTPNWTIVGVAGNPQAACGACHGLPPAAPHPAGADCSTCHPTIAADLSFSDPDRHIDGTVDVVTLDCTTCHGDAIRGDPAPPLDTSGNTATTFRGVGAHQSHLGSSNWHAPIACNACHVRPVDIGDPGHNDSALPAELTWGPSATEDGASPVFDGPTTTCSGVYCHGATLIPGGSNTTPDWTNVGSGEAACGTCHGLPPAAPHPADTDCSRCHTTVAADDVTIAIPGQHVDGVVDLISLDCTSCHGTAANGNPAPPRDTSGNVATTARGVGAHQSHLRASNWRAVVDCSECHVVPQTISSPLHRDSPLPAELSFGGRATADGASPSFNGATTTCSGVYCHGATLQPGGTNTTPNWTSVGTGEVACGTCHSLPPGGTHTTLTTCNDCHGAVVGPGLQIINASLHVDGTVQATNYHPPGWSAGTRHGSTMNNTGFTTCQTCHGVALTGGASGVSCDSCHNGWKTDCTFCHGGIDNMTGAPPEGIDGETTRTLLAVGAHTEHVSATNMHIEWPCTKCHIAPTSATSVGHIDGDGRAEVLFDALNPSATYTPSSGTCGSLYCHGNGSSTLGTMVWSANPVLNCGSCHANFFSPSEASLQQMSGEHRKHVRGEGIGCQVCHSTSVSATGTILQLDRHVDGVIDVAVQGYNPSACNNRGGCNPSCHGNECWN